MTRDASESIWLCKVVELVVIESEAEKAEQRCGCQGWGAKEEEGAVENPFYSRSASSFKERPDMDVTALGEGTRSWSERTHPLPLERQASWMLYFPSTSVIGSWRAHLQSSSNQFCDR